MVAGNQECWKMVCRVTYGFVLGVAYLAWKSLRLGRASLSRLKSSSERIMFHAFLRTSVRICGSRVKETELLGWRKVRICGGLRQLPPSIVRMQAEGKTDRTASKISSKDELWEERR